MLARLDLGHDLPLAGLIRIGLAFRDRALEWLATGSID